MIPVKRKETLKYKKFLHIAKDKRTINLKNTKEMFNYYIDNTSRKERKQMKVDERMKVFHIVWTILLLLGLFILIGTTIGNKANAVLRNDLNGADKHIWTNVMTGSLSSSIKWNWRTLWLKVYWSQVEEMKARWYSNTRILDLLSIKSQECNNYTSCVWIAGLDIWPFQINKIHTEVYKHSYKLHNAEDFWTLYKYQLTFANWLIESYMDRFCNEAIFKEVWKEYSNKARLKCVAISYNWWPDRVNYGHKVWLKRQIIADYLFDNWFLIY